MATIKTITSISHQDSFAKKIPVEKATILQEENTILAPNYSDYISPAAKRRLSPVLKMAITCAKYCQENVSEEFDAISVGTALGCLRDTERFLTTIHTAKGSTLSPTAFIQSTHNTIGGQISLVLKNHAYNMTHTQNSISFEVALIDALLLLQQGKENVLVGAADEAIPFLEELAPEIIQKNYPFTSGATFAVLQNTNSGVKVKDCQIDFSNVNQDAFIDAFLEKNKLQKSDIDVVLRSSLNNITGFEHSINYQQYTGTYYSSSALAFHFAHDTLVNGGSNSALLVNTQSNKRIGLTLLQKT